MQISEHGGVTVQVYPPGERSEVFWRRAGPVFSSLAAQRELGGPFTDDACTTWALAVQGDELPLRGLASVRLERGVGLLDHAWVVPEERGQGVWRALLAARVQACPEARRYQVQANEHSMPGLIRRGFLGRGRRGRYTLMEADGLLLRASLAREGQRG